MDINLLPLALGLAGLALLFTGAMMTGAPLWPQQAEQYKKQIPTVITGLIIVIIAGAIVDIFRGM